MKRTVLVVDDDPLVIEILQTVLNLEEFEVTTASDGATALERVGERRPDVVVLDVMMPGLDGFEVCRRLKADHPSLPVVLLTARNSEADRAEAQDADCDVYLTKPFSPLDLIGRLRDLVGSR